MFLSWRYDVKNTVKEDISDDDVFAKQRIDFLKNDDICGYFCHELYMVVRKRFNTCTRTTSRCDTPNGIINAFVRIRFSIFIYSDFNGIMIIKTH